MSDLVVAPRPHQFIPSSSYCKVYSGKTKQKLHGRTPPTHPPTLFSFLLPHSASKVEQKKEETTNNRKYLFPPFGCKDLFPIYRVPFLLFSVVAGWSVRACACLQVNGWWAGTAAGWAARSQSKDARTTTERIIIIIIVTSMLCECVKKKRKKKPKLLKHAVIRQ